MIDRLANGFDPFVIPFMVGMIFVLAYCGIGILVILFQLSREDRRRFLLSLVKPATAWKNIQDIFLNCLIHVKLWKRNRVLGFMHSSIAFGWFMIIVLGHLEVWLFVPERIRLLYYPIFFNFFVAETETTLQGAVFFFLMDFFLLLILVGIGLAMIKRIRSRFSGCAAPRGRACWTPSACIPCGPSFRSGLFARALRHISAGVVSSPSP